ncbi:MAG: carboxypeptidase M32, partial [Lachnoanaerobaculum sp.]|nr:carboxypeptidase M32 [Lachnoanaerobaculum sp.]
TTTKYIENNVASAILSTVHEVGHAYYEHNIDPKYDGMILSEGVSSGMHESQSRLCENYLGRTMAFWKYNYPKLQAYFPKQLGDVSLEDFYKAINVSKPSFVRTEADELTYPLHVLIRYEIEKGLFNGTISTEGLDKTWNAKYKEYLGVDVPNDKLGILQDVHWSDGSFGYFPTYALGTAFAAQYVHAMKKDLDVDNLLENNKFDVVMNWLKENIHTYGFRYEAPELMKMVTGEEFNVNYFLDYIEEKYTKLYNL